jgi:DNA-binding GntR family transcriptional regulator
MTTRWSKKGRAVPHTTTERIYASLKAAIIDFKFKPGDKLSEGQLGTRFQVSRTPAREALQRLAREGLVRSRPREGYFVRLFDLTEIDKYYEVRIALEMLAVELATPAMQPQVLASLQEFWSHPSGEFSRVDPDLLVRKDERFHETIAAQSGNPFLLRLLREINQHIRIIRRLDYTEPELVHRSFQDHAAVLAQIAGRNGEAAAAQMRDHITESRARTRALAAERLARIYR